MGHYTTADTDLGTLLDDPQARAVLDRHIPSVSNSSRSAMMRGTTLKVMQSYAGGTLPDAVLARIDADLAKLPPRRIKVIPGGGTTDEARVRKYTLPDVLTMANGRKVTSAAMWRQQRRPEILRLYETNVYGRAPGRLAGQRFVVFDKGTPAFGGKAIRRQLTIHVTQGADAPVINLVQYIPVTAKKPVPILLAIGFTAPSAMIADPGIRPTMVWDTSTKRKVAPTTSLPGGGQMDVLRFINAGFGIATFYYGDLEPDFAGGYDLGIRGYLSKRAAPRPDEWGAIAAWAWSLSRAMDYLETDRAVDARRVAIFGASRLGKTALWAAARDERFAAVIACCSGRTGAGIMRRNYGEPTDPNTPVNDPHWLAPNYERYRSKPDDLPLDAHMLLAAIAPRAVLLQTGRTDHAADPKGEFLAAVAAEPVYELLGKRGLGTQAWPPAGPIVNDLAYTMNEGGHGVTPADWDVYFAFLQKHLGGALSEQVHRLVGGAGQGALMPRPRKPASPFCYFN